jgi:outer membrane protein TolC
MTSRIVFSRPVVASAIICIVGALISPLAAQSVPPNSQAPATPAPGIVRLTLDEIKERVAANNKLLQLAAHNVQSKGYATRVAQANYFPQILGSVVYFHFNDDLGTVLTTPGRHVTGPQGVPLANLPSLAINVPVLNQDTTLTLVTAVQPITDLLKVRQGVKIARADEQIAQSQLEKGRRELLGGAEQLFWGLLAAQRIRAGLVAAAGDIEAAAKTGNIEARAAMLEGQQNLQQVSNQIADLQEQLAILLDLATCTQFELVEPAMLAAPVACADEAVAMALANSPEISEAAHTIDKARAAVRAGKLDYVPSIAVIGGYSNQTAADYVQPNIGFIGLYGSYTFVDWGKRRNTIRERDELVAMASLKLEQTRDTVRQETLKAYRDYGDTRQLLRLAGEMVEVRKQAAQQAGDLTTKLKAGKDVLTAEVDYLKADLAQDAARPGTTHRTPPLGSITSPRRRGMMWTCACHNCLSGRRAIVDADVEALGVRLGDK